MPKQMVWPAEYAAGSVKEVRLMELGMFNNGDVKDLTNLA